MSRIDYSVRIEVMGIDHKTMGSGVLYVPKYGNHVYVMTVAHIFREQTETFDIELFFNPDLIDESAWNSAKAHRICAKLMQPDVNSEKNISKVSVLPKYRFGDDMSPEDGAVLEIPREKWMRAEEFIVEKAALKDNLEGWGYPDIMYTVGRDLFCCSVTDIAKQYPSDAGSDDYVVCYDPEKYKATESTDTSYLDCFSGTGMFKAETEDARFVGIFSRDASESPRIFVTDGQKLFNLMRQMRHRNSIVFPNVDFVDESDLDCDSAKHNELSLDLALKRFLENQEDYFRILNGYNGAGKTFVVEYLKNEMVNMSFESDWAKLSECLNANNLSELSDRVYVLDPMERLMKAEERISIMDQGLNGMERLRLKEKIVLLQQISNKAVELQENNIHILFVCRSHFWKDIEVFIKERSFRFWRGFQNRIICCKGYTHKQLIKIQKSNGLQWPEYMAEIPILKQPKWLHRVIREELPTPKEGQSRMDYEFELYQEIDGCFLKDKKGPKVRRLKEGDDVWELEKGLGDYLIEEMKFNFAKPFKIMETYFLLFWNYPFIEEDGGMHMDDDVMEAYLIAKSLNEWIKNGLEDKTVQWLLKLREHVVINPEKGKRIRVFLNKLLDCDETGEWRTRLESWLVKHDDCLEWIHGETEKLDNMVSIIRNNPNLLEDLMFPKGWGYSLANKKQEINQEYRNQDQKEEFQQITKTLRKD